MPRKAATALAAVLVFLAPSQPFWRMPITRPTIMVYPPNVRFLDTPSFFLDNAFHFLEDAPVALVSFVRWDSVRAPRERSLRFES
jgi:hypothetical protein